MGQELAGFGDTIHVMVERAEAKEIAAQDLSCEVAEDGEPCQAFSDELKTGRTGELMTEVEQLEDEGDVQAC